MFPAGEGYKSRLRKNNKIVDISIEGQGFLGKFLKESPQYSRRRGEEYRAGFRRRVRCYDSISTFLSFIV